MRKAFRTIFLALMMVVLYLPIIVLAVYSFTDSANIGAIRGFSVQNYVTLFEKPELRDMIAGTLILAVGSAFISTILGTLGAVGVFYSGRFGNLVVGSLNKVPVVNAEVVTAFSLCILLIGACGVDKSSFVSLVIGHVVLEAPFVYVSVVPKLKQMDNSLYEAALDLGASPAMALRCASCCHRFFRVWFPVLRWQLRCRWMTILLPAIPSRPRLTRLVLMW